MVEIARQPASWTLPPDSPQFRVSPRPAAFRQPDFDESYDKVCIFYDCIRVGTRALLIGPPFENLSAAIASMRIRAMPSGADCNAQITKLDRQAQLWLDTPSATTHVELRSTLGNISLCVDENEAHQFDGKRVLYTLSKNNRPEWIADWIRYHRDVHGANAALLYDNNSTDYRLDELQADLAGIEGVDPITIVPWPFAFGAQGFAGAHWDSDYCQIGAMEDARWRFLQSAKSVISLDIDELVVSPGRSAFELIETSPDGYLRFFGLWVIGTTDRDARLTSRQQRGEAARHTDFQHTLRVLHTWQRHPKWQVPLRRRLNRSIQKWGVVPARCPMSAHWTAHGITKLPEAIAPLHRISYRHLREINTSWKYDRSRREVFDPRKHYLDVDLAAAYASVRWDA